ncbi:unnamed protein product [Rhizoctonia solani]|uniref:Uncharacterized protein n=1 Tax=Rhizoctonia solani TaxID=456999 RepID=A0A8H3EBA4_9AGAM|nr:unnamed protein product [Rhizoctonia solani]
MRGRAVSNDPNEPLEEGEERSPEQRVGKPNPRGKRRPDPKGNWDSFVADEDEEMSEPLAISFSLTPAADQKSFQIPVKVAQEYSRHHYTIKLSREAEPPPTPSSIPFAFTFSAHSQVAHSVAGSITIAWSISDSLPFPLIIKASPISLSLAISPVASNPRSRTLDRTRPQKFNSGAQPFSHCHQYSRTFDTHRPAFAYWGQSTVNAHCSRPRGDREPPRGPRNMVGLNAGPPPSAPGMNSGPGWDRPQLAFQSYLAAVQSKLDERQGKRKDEDTADDEPNIADPATAGVKGEPDAMDLDAPEEHGTGRSYSNTPAPGPSIGGSRVASPAHPYVRQSSTSLHASPLVGQGVSLPASSGPGLPHTAQLSQFPQSHPLPLPPRPRSPPRGPRATRGLPEKPKAVGPEPGREGGVERDRGADIIDRGRNRNDWGDKGRASGEPERKGHILGTNLAQQIRAPAPRATTRNSLFPELEKELAALEEQRMRLANEHFPLEVALRQAVDELALSTIEYRAAEDRRIMTETVLEAMVKGGGLAASGDI